MGPICSTWAANRRGPVLRRSSAEEERARTEPVVAGLAAAGHEVSIDTSKLAVAEAALDAGASIVNDVTALRGDPEIAALCAERGAGLVLMHMQGDPRTMQENPTYDDVVDDVRAFLAERLEAAVAAGVAEERIWLDPGIGFGKTLEHNLELLRRLGELADAGPAAGRRRLAQELHRQDRRLRGRASGSAARSPPRCWPAAEGADVLRVHDVAEVAGAGVAAAILGPARPTAGVSGRLAAAVEAHGNGDRVDGSRSSCAASRSTPTTASPTPSRRSASGSSSTSPSTCPTATRCSPTGSRTPSTTPRSATSSPWPPPSAATAPSSGSARWSASG